MIAWDRVAGAESYRIDFTAIAEGNVISEISRSLYTTENSVSVNDFKKIVVNNWLNAWNDDLATGLATFAKQSNITVQVRATNNPQSVTVTDGVTITASPYILSDPSEAITIKNPIEPYRANFQYDAETGILSWDSCEEVEAYVSEPIYGVYVNGEYLTAIGRGFYGYEDKISVNLVQCLAERDYFRENEERLVGDLTITIIAGNFLVYSYVEYGETPGIPATDSFSFHYDGCDLNSDLKAPTNIWAFPTNPTYWTDPNNTPFYITWDDPANAVAYLIRISGENVIHGFSRINNTDYPNNWALNFPGAAWDDPYIPDGEYQYEVCAVDKNGDRSEWSAPMAFTVKDRKYIAKFINEPLGYPAGALATDGEGDIWETAHIHIDESGNLTWYTAMWATGYNVYIKGEGVDLVEKVTENVLEDINGYLKDQPNGEYTIVVGSYNDFGIERKQEKDSFTFTKHEACFFDEENQKAPAKPTVDDSEKAIAAATPDEEKVESVAINPAFNIQLKKDAPSSIGALELDKITLKAKEIFAEEAVDA
ncbi:MAG: hypothetical protein NC084_11450, partial [Bacteroides sp.]|nr:hypothetical protein [Bacteroides sp.]